MLFIDLALTVYLMWQSTLNRGYSNDIFFWIFCSIPSLLEDLLIRLEVSYVLSIQSFKIRIFFTISPTAKFKSHPKQCMKNAFGFSDKPSFETPSLTPHIFFASSDVFSYVLSGKTNCWFDTAGKKFTLIRKWIWITLAENCTTTTGIRNTSAISTMQTKTTC